jgi:hypothetical protein
MPVVITGLAELRAALRRAELASPRVVTAALKVGAQEVTARSRELVPKGNHEGRSTPTMVSTLKAFSNAKGAGVKTNHPGAGVQNFATTYSRKGPNGGPEQEVTLVNVSAFGANKDRFLYKAVEEVGPELAEKTFDDLVEVLKCQGWFQG